VEAANILCDVRDVEDPLSCLEDIAKTGAALNAEFLSLRQRISELPSLIPQPCPGLANRFEWLERRNGILKVRVKDYVWNEMANVIVEDDVGSVKRLIGGRDPLKMQIQRGEMPARIFLPDRYIESFSLIEVAAGGGAERAFGLLETFFGMISTGMAFELAIMNGHRALVRSIWDRLPAEEKVPELLLSCAIMAAKYHRADVLIWLVNQPEALCGAARGFPGDSVLDQVSEFVMRPGLAPAALALSAAGVDFGAFKYRLAAGGKGWISFLEMLPPRGVDEWSAFLLEEDLPSPV
jgi:hypothetical protein